MRQPKQLLFRLPLVCAFYIVTSCQPSEQADLGTGPTVRDSSGVRIVELPGALLSDLPSWSIAEQPDLAIGLVEGPEPYLFGRIADAAKLESGQLVVLDGQARVIRVFDGEGLFLSEMSGYGEGPAELQDPTVFRTVGDTAIALYDRLLRKIAVFNVNEGFVETEKVMLEGCPPHDPRIPLPSCYVSGLLNDLTRVVTGFGPRSPSLNTQPGETATSGRRVRSFGLADGNSVTTLDTVLSETTTYVHDSKWLWFISTAFDWSGGFVAGKDRVVVATNSTFEYRVWLGDGRLGSIVRVDTTASQLRSSHLDPIRAWAASGESPYDPSRYLAEAPFPDTIPFFGEVLVDEVGRVWLAEYGPDVELLPREFWDWTVFAADGLPQARIRTRSPSDLLEIGEDYVLMRLVDDLGVHTLGLFDLLRG